MEAAPANADQHCDDDYELPAAYLRFIDKRIIANALCLQNDSENFASRNHCEVYVIVYEPSVNHVYVRDRKSVNGTFVNGQLIGSGPQITPGYLLEDGDVIEIQPHWKFLFRQPRKPPTRPLTAIQTAECQFFKNEYLITPRCLGSGAEGAVYLAIESKTKRQLVCKLVNLGKQDGTMPREDSYRKLQEIDVLRQLKHPNILPYIDAVVSPHTLYIFTELAAGGDLVSFINRHEFIQEIDCRVLLRQVVRGLAYLHRKGIIHRDLKPENILLAYSPKIAYHRIMLSDFGACAVPRRSRMMTDIGTFEYKAPEVFFSAAEAQTTALDMWSLGLVTLRMLTFDVECFGSLTRMDQKSLEQMVNTMIEDISPKRSSNSQRFVLACLQLAPMNRITAAEAECHDWFCTPQKHFEFFQQLDQRCQTELTDDDTHLKPMPWDLASLQPLSPAPTPAKASATTSGGSGLRLMRWASPSCVETSGHLGGAQESGQAAKSGPLPGLSSPQGSGPLTPKLQLTKEIPDTTQNAKQSLVTPQRDGDAGNRRPEVRILTSRQLRICDVLQLPLPDLNRHLKQARNEHRREEVLAELKRLNAKFLTDTMQAIVESEDAGAEGRRG
ncbi:kinase-like protein [Trichoderma citrinoviride]|uniref:non-specific serine/threonine protein kinase n=1 Tax=Trichoderma citrinoviride TaxID=58853 RepID=A0A2T4BET0_9HYPO|nr:kinase-like protein [Trichoderma citrinoviride]PTB67847.1 kinase-like protein [Trichoderma citrinoviride]